MAVKLPDLPAGAPIRLLPGLFFGTALVGLLAGLYTLASHAAYLVGAGYGDLPVIFANHWFALAWITTAEMGSSIQLLAVILQVRPARPRLLLVHYALWVAGLLLFMTGLGSGRLALLSAGAATLLLAVVTYLVHQFWTASTCRQWSLPGVALVTAMGWLGVAATWGLLLALNFVFGYWPGDLPNLPVHFAIAGGGWISLAILGVSYQLVPMFSLGDHRRQRFGWAVYAAANAGLVLLLAGLWAGRAVAWEVAGLLAWILAAVLWGLDIRAIVASRRRRSVDPAIRHLAAGWLALLILCLLLLANRLGFLALPDHRRLALGALFLLGWASFAILGYLHKIIPFLVWVDLFRGRIGKEAVPGTRDLFWEDGERITGVAWAVGVVLVVAGLWWAWPAGVAAGAMVAGLAAAGVAVNLGRTLLGRVGRAAVAGKEG